MCHSSRCMICDGPVVGTRWVCMECAARWALGPSVAEWPEWARLLKRLEERRRRYDATEPPMVSLDLDGNAPSCSDAQPDALMEYAPYEDEDANREYRKACGIEERDGREGDIRGDAAAHSVGGEGVG